MLRVGQVWLGYTLDTSDFLIPFLIEEELYFFIGDIILINLHPKGIIT